MATPSGEVNCHLEHTGEEPFSKQVRAEAKSTAACEVSTSKGEKHSSRKRRSIPEQREVITSCGKHLGYVSNKAMGRGSNTVAYMDNWKRAVRESAMRLLTSVLGTRHASEVSANMWNPAHQETVPRRDNRNQEWSSRMTGNEWPNDEPIQHDFFFYYMFELLTAIQACLQLGLPFWTGGAVIGAILCMIQWLETRCDRCLFTSQEFGPVPCSRKMGHLGNCKRGWRIGEKLFQAKRWWKGTCISCCHTCYGHMYHPDDTIWKPCERPAVHLGSCDCLKHRNMRRRVIDAREQLPRHHRWSFGAGWRWVFVGLLIAILLQQCGGEKGCKEQSKHQGNNPGGAQTKSSSDDCRSECTGHTVITPHNLDYLKQNKRAPEKEKEGHTQATINRGARTAQPVRSHHMNTKAARERSKRAHASTRDEGEENNATGVAVILTQAGIQDAGNNQWGQAVHIWKETPATVGEAYKVGISTLGKQIAMKGAGELHPWTCNPRLNSPEPKETRSPSAVKERDKTLGKAEDFQNQQGEQIHGLGHMHGLIAGY